MFTETLRVWVRQAERDTGKRHGLTTDERARMRELERENKELRRANEMVFIERAFRDGAIPVTGTAIAKILPPVSRFSADDRHGEKKQRVLIRLGQFLERFFGLSAAGDKPSPFDEDQATPT